MTNQPLLEHLIELRTRLIYCLLAIALGFGVSWLFSEDIYAFLVRPLSTILREKGEHQLIYTSLGEAFMMYMRLSFWSGFMLAFPFVAFQLWRFVAPGLYKHEKRLFLPFLFASPLLFFLGAALAYYFIFPLAWDFFLSFETAAVGGTLPLHLEAKVSEYLSLVLQLIFAFGICFQLPVLLVLLIRLGILSTDRLVKSRKYVFVGAFLVGAILTPPDVFSQIGLAIPLYTLFEVSIWIGRFLEKREAAVAGSISL